ncbi:hypothetical protein [Pseudanabaena yagii]|uniref:Uncharacterized protein n=1 Tax=Pseudanabaena yagii GIHE-NHR1 TaxID=2722753 RepID=A0ABX1LYC1_9CYAN|nr:hypothetical protein [Pseudanabaena yagii]NMF60361.1 hypothetical protein [Pseudanabaena yagii GIHE-NHR1]
MATQDKRILIDYKKLRNRHNVVKPLLKPLALNYQRLDVSPIGRSSTEHIVAAKDNISKPNARYDEMRFRTIGELRAMYYERWYKISQNREELFYLDRAYLHFYMIEPSISEEKEFALLHCDPNEPDNAAHAKYKQSLHLHIECSDSSCYPHCHIWPHAHIALNTGYLNHVLKDIDSLTQAVKEAIYMLKEEVLDPLSKHI